MNDEICIGGSCADCGALPGDEHGKFCYTRQTPKDDTIRRSDLVRWLRAEAKRQHRKAHKNSKSFEFYEYGGTVCYDLAARIESGEKIGGTDEH